MNSNNSILKSISIASNGLITALKSERNIKIQITIGLLTILLSYFFKVSLIEFIIILICIGIIISLELMNTAIEKCLDLYSLEYNPKIKSIKDVSAASVFFSSILIFIVGCLIFIPKCLKYIE